MELEKTANPAPLGLMGFGMTTVLLNLHNVGLYPMTSMILAMGICFGGLAQIIAGLLEFKRGNTFATTAFISYGCFWLSFVVLLVLPATGIPAAQASSESFMGWYLFMWGVFTLFMFFGTLKGGKGLQVVFFSLTILFFLLALRDWTHSNAIGTIAGIIGIFCGSSAIWVAMAEVLHEQLGHKLMPY